MTLHTGGFALATISTKSKPALVASLRASSMLTTPACSPSAFTRRTSLALISSLMFKRFDFLMLMGITPHQIFDYIDPFGRQLVVLTG